MITFKNVSKSFDEELVISNKTIEFPEKGIVCIFGPSGVGKTTIFNLIAGLIEPDDGVIVVTEDISMVFQEDRLVPWLTAGENISLVLNDKELEQTNGVKQTVAIKNMNVIEHLNAMQLIGVETKRPSELSGGMKRRVAIARAIAYDKKIMLMDEPFKGLEVELKNLIMDQVILLAEDKLIVIVTHEKVEMDYLKAEVVWL